MRRRAVSDRCVHQWITMRLGGTDSRIIARCRHCGMERVWNWKDQSYKRRVAAAASEPEAGA